ncbi:vacuolar iron transporter homolog 4-like protein [Tanacetum coccineum]
MASKTDVCIPVCEDRSEHGQVFIEEDIDYSHRGQWLCVVVLGVTDGLVSVASLMMGIRAIKQDVGVMDITGLTSLVVGECNMTIGEFVSVYSQLDVEVAQMKRDNIIEKETLPNPIQATVASALAFIVGAILSLLDAAL